MLRALIYLLPLALAVYTVIDCLNTPEDEVKHLPKLAWIVIVLLFGIAGPIVWFIAGKKRGVPGGGWVAPDDNPEFLKSLGDGTRKNETEPDGTDPDGTGTGGTGTDGTGKDATEPGEPGPGESRHEGRTGPEDPTPPAAS